MIEQPPTTVAGQWRPQGFGSRKSKDVSDPIIEPVWIGDRVLVHVERDVVRIVDDGGEPTDTEVPELAAIVDELQGAIHAGTLVLDGYLTHQATMPAPLSLPELVEKVSAGEMTAQMFLGRQARRKRLAREVEAEKAVLSADTPLAFVAVDLLELDGSELLSVPLLERKRLLDSALEEGDLVRRTAFVRPPVDAWLGTWRSLGFTQVVYKDANGRYAPGAASDGWALARIPQH